MMKKVELLSPAGSIEAFEAALNAGADAIYLAGSRFGARAYAENFDDETLLQVIKKAHLCGVRIHLTVNTLTRENELEDMLEFLSPLYEAGLDAVIVQDLGVLSLLHQKMPDLALHASTQLSVTTPDAVRFLAGLGVTRVVPARELSLDEIKVLKAELPIEVETFIHGAMCYCYSGKCLFSSFLGGRSGNRGRCAQTCRLPYRILDGDEKAIGPDAVRSEYYPLSMKDLMTIEILPELILSGIDSFKIEGRMKKPEYAAGVTRVYRKYIDLALRLIEEGREKEYRVSKEDLSTLSSLYLRTERSEGYYHQYNGRSLVTIGKPGYLGADEELLQDLRNEYIHPVNGPSIRLKADFAEGERSRLTASAKPVRTGNESREGEIVAFAEGEEAKKAISSPLTEASVLKNLSKTGDTVFSLESASITLKGELFLPVGKINELRRDVFTKLEEGLLHDYNDRRIKELGAVREAINSSLVQPERGKKESFPEGRLFAVITRKNQAKEAKKGGADLLIDDTALFDLAGEDAFLALPYAIRKKSAGYLDESLERLKAGEYSGALVRNPEGLFFLRNHGYKGTILTDSSLYCWNKEALRVLSMDSQGFVYPLELSGREIEDTFRDTLSNRGILMAYGRAPMMISAGCVRKSEKACSGKEEDFMILKDRKKESFYVRTVCPLCTNIIYNSVPTSLLKASDDLLFRKSRGILLSFTNESPEDVFRITAAFRKAVDGKKTGEDLRINYTTGHYRKGAL